MRTIEIEAGDARARLRLLDDRAPRATAALWETLPIEGDLTHARWAGAACWVKVDRAPLTDVKDVESQVSSIYKGTLVLRPNPAGRAELYLSYGQAESRHERGRTYVTPLAQVEGDGTSLFEALASTWQGGSIPVHISRVEQGNES